MEKIYGFEASPGLIPAITDAVKEEVGTWRNRPLEPCYPVVFMDAVRVNIRSDGAVSNKAVFVAPAILPDGTGDVPGLWFRTSEGAKFRARVLNDLRNQGVQDILIAVVDGLKGFARAIEAAFPQTCIVHLLRHSMICCAGHKDRNAVAAALKAVYTAVDAEPAEAAPVEFEESDLARQYPAIAPNRRRAWNEVIPFLGYPPGVRRPVHTTDAIKALNSTIRRAVRTRGHFPSDEAAAKLIDPALNATSTEWKRSAREWHAVKSSSQSCSKNAYRWRENAPQNKIPLSLDLGQNQHGAATTRDGISHPRVHAHRRPASFSWNRTRSRAENARQYRASPCPRTPPASPATRPESSVPYPTANPDATPEPGGDTRPSSQASPSRSAPRAVSTSQRPTAQLQTAPQPGDGSLQPVSRKQYVREDHSGKVASSILASFTDCRLHFCHLRKIEDLFLRLFASIQTFPFKRN